MCSEKCDKYEISIIMNPMTSKLIVKKLIPQSIRESMRYANNHWGEIGLANAGVNRSKMVAPKVGKSVFCSFDVFYHNFRTSYSPTVVI